MRTAGMLRNYGGQAQEGRSWRGLRQQERRRINLIVCYRSWDGVEKELMVISAKGSLLPRSSEGSYRPNWSGEDS